MAMRIECLPEPELEFFNGKSGWEPKRMLHAPISGHRQHNVKEIRLGLVALPDEVPAVKRWLERMHHLIVSDESNARRFRAFPGTETVFKCRFELPKQFIRTIDTKRYQEILSLRKNESFEELLRLYGDRIRTLFGDLRPDCVLVCFPEELAELRITNPRLTHGERIALERLQKEEEEEQLELFEPTQEERRLAAELEPQAEELLFRNFYRALKADCMMHPNPVPIQVMRRHTYVDDETLQRQSDATRAWNLTTSLYYKAGNIPWRPRGLSTDTCFVGVSFHHLKRRSGDLIYASVAQAFSSDVEPFALKGATIPPGQVRDKRPYLTEQQAAELMRDVIAAYELHTGCRPARVVVHKTSRYQMEEERGFRQGLLDEIAACELVWVAPTGFRLLRKGMQEPWRGTLCSVGGDEHYLFTTGFVPWWDEYPGPHIPAPLQIGAVGKTDMIERAREILMLTKMNWNNAEGIGRHPITLSFARKVGAIMTEIGDEDVNPNPLYRYYM